MKKPLLPTKPSKILAERQYLDGKAFSSYNEIPYEDFLKTLSSLTKDQDPQKCLIEVNSEYSEYDGCWTEIDCYLLINDPKSDYELKLAQYEKDLKEYNKQKLIYDLKIAENKVKELKKLLEFNNDQEKNQ